MCPSFLNLLYFFSEVLLFSVAYDLHAYSEIRQDGGRTIPHPIGLESSPSSAKFGADSNDGRTRGIFGFWRNEGEVGSRRAKVEWKDTPPKEVANHDYAWWHEKEVSWILICLAPLPLVSEWIC